MNASSDSWLPLAACRGADTNLFFPELGDSSAPAKAMCGRCPVRVECLNYALEACERDGWWGGASPKDRRRLKRLRRAA